MGGEGKEQEEGRTEEGVAKHKEIDCKSVWKCRKCKGDYHQYLCPKKPNSTAAQQKTAGKAIEHLTVVKTFIPNNKEIGLKTTMVQIY